MCMTASGRCLLACVIVTFTIHASEALNPFEGGEGVQNLAGYAPAAPVAVAQAAPVIVDEENAPEAPVGPAEYAAPVPFGGSSVMSDCSRSLAKGRGGSQSDRITNKWSKMKTHWGTREGKVVEAVRPNKAAIILDLGCGIGHLGKALRKRFPDFHYYPVDAFPRPNLPDQLLCNFNKYEYPLTLNPKPTTIILQGLIEYIYDKQVFLQSLRNAYPEADIISTFHVWKRQSNKAYNRLWVTPVDKRDILQMLGSVSKLHPGGSYTFRKLPPEFKNEHIPSTEGQYIALIRSNIQQ